MHDTDLRRDRIERRTYLAAAGTLAVGALAGCTTDGNGDGGTPTGTPDEVTDPSEMDLQTPADAPTVSFAMAADGGIVTATSDGPDAVQRSNLEIRVDDETVADGSAFSGDGDTVVEGDQAAVFVADGEPTAAPTAPDGASGLSSGSVVAVVWTGATELTVGYYQVG